MADERAETVRQQDGSVAETQLEKVRRHLIRLSKMVVRPSTYGVQVVRRDREDGSIEYQVFADTKGNGRQIAWVQSSRCDAEFIAACLAQASVFDQLLASPVPSHEDSQETPTPEQALRMFYRGSLVGLLPLCSANPGPLADLVTKCVNQALRDGQRSELNVSDETDVDVLAMRVARDIDFAIDVTEPREVLLRRFVDIIRPFIRAPGCAQCSRLREALEKVSQDIRTIAMVAGQCSVEGPKNLHAAMAAAEAEWADRIDAAILQPEGK